MVDYAKGVKNKINLTSVNFSLIMLYICASKLTVNLLACYTLVSSAKITISYTSTLVARYLGWIPIATKKR
jgi:hypothetical protein